MRKLTLVLAACLPIVLASNAEAAELKVLTAGAMRSVIVALAPDFEKQTGHTLAIENETVGALVRKIEGGASFDVVVATPAALDTLSAKAFVADNTRSILARVGIGVMVKTGAHAPDVGSLDAFRRALLAAKSVAYIDPASGGSSGIYLARLFERMGIADEIAKKARLKQGGYVADLIVSGEAELGIHQISEIVPVSGVTLVAPLPPEVQNYTVYAAAVGAKAKDAEGARALVRFLSGPAAPPVFRAKGMDVPST
jgi:molybdate transport system substrate-binding protein